MPALLDYFRRFAQSDDPESAFHAAFGEPVATFHARFESRLTHR